MKNFLLLICIIPILAISAEEFDLEKQSEGSRILYDYYKLTITEAPLVGRFMVLKYDQSDLSQEQNKKELFFRITSQEKMVIGLNCQVDVIKGSNQNHSLKILDGRQSGCHPQFFKVVESVEDKQLEYELSHKVLF